VEETVAETARGSGLQRSSQSLKDPSPKAARFSQQTYPHSPQKAIASMTFFAELWYQIPQPYRQGSHYGNCFIDKRLPCWMPAIISDHDGGGKVKEREEFVDLFTFHSIQPNPSDNDRPKRPWPY